MLDFRGVQWNASKNSSKPSWTPQPMSATTGAGYKPMNQQLNNAPFGALFTPAAPILGQPMYPQLSQMVRIDGLQFGNFARFLLRTRIPGKHFLYLEACAFFAGHETNSSNNSAKFPGLDEYHFATTQFHRSPATAAALPLMMVCTLFVNILLYKVMVKHPHRTLVLFYDVNSQK